MFIVSQVKRGSLELTIDGVCHLSVICCKEGENDDFYLFILELFFST